MVYSRGDGQLAEVVIMRPNLVSGMIILNEAIGLESHKDINILLFIASK